MSSPEPRSTSASVIGKWAIGTAAGVVIGLFISILPVVTIGLIVVVAVATWISFVRREGGDHHLGLAGMSLGSGSVLLYAAASTFQSCTQTDDFCGNANIAPLIAFALFGLASGVIVSVVAFADRQRR
jgi:hypothetical protein